jgi:glutathione peroxidase
MKRIGSVLTMGFLNFLGACTGAIEQVPYTVLEKYDAIELREYKPYVLAQTRVEGTFDNAGNDAFNRLFKYISGNNRSKQSIAMTAPVNQQAASQKIAMTAPVNQQKAGDAFLVSFVMPAEFTLETLPEPLDKQVELKQIPGHVAAAITYSGSWEQKNYLTHKTKLEQFMGDKGWTADGEPVYARYNSPFSLSFLRRNEVVIPVASIYGFTINDIDGKPVTLSKYRGKALLVVNVASQCGYTPQYAGLQKLYEQYKEKGLEILAFPANNFGEQEPGNNTEIKTFCTSKYAVTFPLFSKISVAGDDIHPLYAYLTSAATSPKFGGKITWNFNKFLIDKSGVIINRFDSKIKPDDLELVRAVEEALK